MSPNAASPRPRSHRRGTSHLSLVTDETPVTPAVADDEATGPKHAAPAPRLMVAGSATMRALIGLGAILSALGLSFGKAQALEAALLPNDAPAEAEPEVPGDNTATDPAHKAPATGTETSARKISAPGTWTPTVTPAVTRTYTIPAPAGRHRGQADADEYNHVHERPTGRHRGNGQHGGHNRPRSRHDGTTRPAGKAKGVTLVTGYDVRSV